MTARKEAKRTKSRAFQVRITDEMVAAFDELMGRIGVVQNARKKPASRTDLVFWWLTWLTSLSAEEQVRWATEYRDGYLEDIRRGGEKPGGKPGKAIRGRALPGVTLDARRKLDGNAKAALEPAIPRGIA